VSQSVAPHVPPVAHAAVQQSVPIPVGPQTRLWHWWFELHAEPAPCLATHAPPEQKVPATSQS
jgi:hypothetical protein